MTILYQDHVYSLFAFLKTLNKIYKLNTLIRSNMMTFILYLHCGLIALQKNVKLLLLFVTCYTLAIFLCYLT